MNAATTAQPVAEALMMAILRRGEPRAFVRTSETAGTGAERP